uniref:cyclic nucleotide-binding domain-containing protein n=1 Tax=Azohydromonas aeria TaxID=2590212 RepID=UPI0012F849BA
MKTVSPGEAIFAEGFVGIPAMYLIKTGEVEISAVRDDVKVVLARLGKGQFFGEEVLLSASAEARGTSARALSYCELQMIDAAGLRALADGAAPLLRHMLLSLIQSGQKKDALLAAHENIQTQPDILSYAHILALMAAPEAGGTGMRRDREKESSLAVADVVKHCRGITGHSRRHVATTLKRMAMLNLVTLDRAAGTAPRGGPVRGGGEIDTTVEAALGGAHTLRFNHEDIVPRAQELARHNLDDKLHREQELIELADVATLTGVDRALLLRKLAQGELADELFNFRRSEVLRFVAEKGRDYFARRQGAGQLQSIEDLATVDKRVLFEALNGIDTLELAKLFQHLWDETVRERLLGCLARARREEIERCVAEDVPCDAEEAQLVEEALLEAVRELRRPRGRAAAP